jgi:hypothetical protein
MYLGLRRGSLFPELFTWNLTSHILSSFSMDESWGSMEEILHVGEVVNYFHFPL